jgi:hypothetical protein
LRGELILVVGETLDLRDKEGQGLRVAEMGGDNGGGLRCGQLGIGDDSRVKVQKREERRKKRGVVRRVSHRPTTEINPKKTPRSGCLYFRSVQERGRTRKKRGERER